MPEKILVNCSECSCEAAALWTGDTLVSWCERGHVVVVDAEKHKLVHDFSLKGLNE